MREAVRCSAVRPQKITPDLNVIVRVNVIVFVIVFVNVIVTVTVIVTDSCADIKIFADFLAVMELFAYICARF